MDLTELSRECNVACGECEQFEQCCYLVKKDKSNQRGKNNE